MCTGRGELTEMVWLSLFGERGAWSEIVWFVAQTHTLKGKHRKWSCCKTERLMERTAVSLVETETIRNFLSVTTSSLLSSATALLTHLLAHGLQELLVQLLLPFPCLLS